MILRRSRPLAQFVIAMIVAGVAMFAWSHRRRPSGFGDWSVQEVAGAAILGEPKCARCHAAGEAPGPIDPQHVSRSEAWLTQHFAAPDPQTPTAAAGLNARESDAVQAALIRLRTSAPPPASASDVHVAVLVTRFCLKCHVIDGVGSAKEADLSAIGSEHDRDWLQRWIADPVAIKPETDMPQFAAKMTPEEIDAIASWLAARR